MTRADGIHGGERICPDTCGVTGGRFVGIAGGEIDGHSIQSIVECNAGVAVTGNGIIAIHSLEFVEGTEVAGVCTGGTKIGRYISNVESKRDFLRTMTPALLTDGLRIEGGI